MWAEYNIHGIVNIRTNFNLGLHQYFHVASNIHKPDIIVYVGNIKIKNSKLKRIGRRYYGEDYGKVVYDILPVPTGKFGLILKNLMGKNTFLGVTPWYANLVRKPLGFYVLPIDVHFQALLDVKLLQKGYTLLHCSGIAVNDRKAILFTGLGGAGKSLAVFLASAIKKDSYYLSDDLLISDGVHAYCFPQKQQGIGSLINKVTSFLLVAPKYRHTLDYVQPNRTPIIKFGKVHEICFLENGPHQLIKLDRDEALDKLLITKAAGVGSFSNNSLIMAYRYFNPVEAFANFEKREKEIISSLVEKANCHKLVYSNTSELRDMFKKII